MNLGSIGMPGCFGHVSPDISALLLGSGNVATYAAAIPTAACLIGGRFFQQALVLDLGANNTAGLVISDAAAAVINGAPGGIAGGVVPNMVTISPGTLSGSTVRADPRT